MSAPRSGPLRPSLSRGNVSTSSVPQYDLRDKASGRHGKSGYTAASANSMLSSPPYPAKAPMASDMFRAESNDSHRSLKNKSSRKDLRELQRSASPMAPPPPPSSTRHQYSRSWDDENVDDDARSIASFTCSFADEFDVKNRGRARHDEERGGNSQRFLDAVFRKLSLKTGVHQRESWAWEAVDRSIAEEQRRGKAASSKASKAKPHFLDLSGYISPVPTTHLASLDVTPRPADSQRFPSGLLSPQQHTHTSRQHHQERPLLRSRKSADSVGESRRLQREQCFAVPLVSTRGSLTAESVGGATPSGMSHALLARATNSSSHAPVPSLPAWARSNNLSLQNQPSPTRFHGMARVGSHDGLSQAPVVAHRPVDMNRAASHDASMYLQRPVRSVLTSRDVNGPFHGQTEGFVGDQQSTTSTIPTSLQVRNSKSRAQMSPLSPNSPQWPRSGLSLRDEEPSPTASAVPALIHRGSTSSAASDSGASSCISSVPHTPTTRPLALAHGSLHSLGYSEEEEMEMTADEEEHLLSGMGRYALDGEKQHHQHRYYFGKPNCPTVTAQAYQQRPPHVAMLFACDASAAPLSSSSRSAAGATAWRESEEEGNTTVRATHTRRRQRAATMSEHSPSKTALPSSPSRCLPQSPGRSSSLQKSTRDSIASSASISTTSSASASSSNSESILSYTKGSPTSTCASPIGSPHYTTSSSRSLGTTTPTSPRKRNATSKAEDWASSIGRRFAKSSLKSGASPVLAPVPSHAA